MLKESSKNMEDILKYMPIKEAPIITTNPYQCYNNQ